MDPVLDESGWGMSYVVELSLRWTSVAMTTGVQAIAVIATTFQSRATAEQPQVKKSDLNIFTMYDNAL
jgi:hypothetical protein